MLAVFFNFAAAIRYYNHVSIEINVPQPREEKGDIAADTKEKGPADP